MFNNNVNLTGYLGADPKAYTSSTGKTFAAARLAITKRYTDRSGNAVEDTQWFGFVAFGRTAERLLARARRGNRISIEGRLTARNYETSTGEKRQSVQVQVAAFELLPKRSASSSALVELIADANQHAIQDSQLDSQLDSASIADSIAFEDAFVSSAATTPAASAKTNTPAASAKTLTLRRKRNSAAA